MHFWSLPLFLTACLGHFVMGLAIYNWLYGAIVNEHHSDVLRGSWALFLAAMPALFWFFFGFDALAPFESAWTSWPHLLLTVYLVLCWMVCLVVLPLVTLWRGLRRPPAALVSEKHRLVDVASDLKTRPLGDHKLRMFGTWPGNEIFQIDLVEKTLLVPRLPPACDGLTILHLSDLHMCGTPDKRYFERVIDLCNDWHPDLIALTGDVVDSDRHHRWVLRVFGRLRAKIATFAILGNHDYRYNVERIRRRLRRCGMRVLVNTWERLDVRGEPMIVIGHEGPWLAPPPDLGKCPPNEFRLCLSHTPDNIAWARRNNIDLMLSGHVHGGQIRLPVFGSVFVPSRYGRRYDCGVFVEPPTTLHVSRGVAGEQPVRFNCRPEATLLTLRRPANV